VAYSPAVVILLRLLKALLTSALRPAIEPLGTAAIHMRVWPNDLDLNIHVSSGRYLSFMDVGRVELLARMRLFRKVMNQGWRPINGGTMITYRKSLLLWERFTVKTRILCWDEKWFYFEHIIERRNGELAAIANTRGLIRGSDGNVAPAQVIELSGRHVDSPPIPECIIRWGEAESAR
ncbi:MAG: acyl-CoA thioesterase, partial [Thermoanaerobaculia bacterium]